MKQAMLALADGTVFRGLALGHEGETIGEVVFNTAMTGYQEILTDPSYKGQIVTMTCPHIGNYGVVREDAESRRVWTEGFVVTEGSRQPSNWRSHQSLDAYLREARVVGIQGIDTRALTRHLREQGAQQAVISHLELDAQRLVAKARSALNIVGRDLVKEVTCDRAYEWIEGSDPWLPDELEGGARGQTLRTKSTRTGRYRVVVYDFGVKQNILRRLVDVGCAVTVVPAATPAAEVLQLNPDGVVLSNGPGDPEGVPYASAAVKALIGRRPLMGICLGHQLVGLAMGLRTYKLKFGHHGANHPVMDLRTRTVEITSQNHNFAVQAPGAVAQDLASVVDTALGRVQISHCSLNDDSVEGLVGLDQPVFSVQYHPEASPGPHDSAYLFQEFTQMMEKHHG
ncbi:MAG: glutamine-hydrolyzing carbamoyl-phosphate synthase small subunit [Nitrospiraceae bacterium]